MRTSFGKWAVSEIGLQLLEKINIYDFDIAISALKDAYDRKIE